MGLVRKGYLTSRFTPGPTGGIMGHADAAATVTPPQESFVTNRKRSSIALANARSPGSCRAIWRARFVHARIGTTLFPTLLGPLVAKVAQACINRLSFFEELATPVSGLGRGGKITRAEVAETRAIGSTKQTSEIGKLYGLSAHRITEILRGKAFSSPRKPWPESGGRFYARVARAGKVYQSSARQDRLSEWSGPGTQLRSKLIRADGCHADRSPAALKRAAVARSPVELGLL
jgi:hypothetical protein